MIVVPDCKTEKKTIVPSKTAVVPLTFQQVEAPETNQSSTTRNFATSTSQPQKDWFDPSRLDPS